MWISIYLHRWLSYEKPFILIDMGGSAQFRHGGSRGSGEA